MAVFSGMKGVLVPRLPAGGSFLSLLPVLLQTPSCPGFIAGTRFPPRGAAIHPGCKAAGGFPLAKPWPPSGNYP